MRACGVQPNTYTYNALISVHAKAGDVQRGCGLLREMERYPESAPSTSTYTSLIDACGRAGDATTAFDLLAEMEVRSVPKALDASRI